MSLSYYVFYYYIFYLTLQFNYRLLLLRSYTYKKHTVNSKSYNVRQFVSMKSLLLEDFPYEDLHASRSIKLVATLQFTPTYCVKSCIQIAVRSKKPRVCACTYIYITYHRHGPRPPYAYVCVYALRGCKPDIYACKSKAF